MASARQLGDEKTGGKGLEKTFSKNMTDDKMTFLRHTNTVVKPLSQTCDQIWRVSVRNEKKRVCVRAVRCCLYTPRRVHGSCHCLDAKLPERTKI